jgi:formylglycine-generating enzyme required for sulfatase activity
VLLLSLLLLGWAGYECYGWVQAEKLVQALVSADTADVRPLVEQLTPYHRWAVPRLQRHAQEAPDNSKEHLHAALALLPVDGGQVEYLYGRLLTANPTELSVIRDALQGRRDAPIERLWAVLDDSKDDPERSFRAACALATYDVTADDANKAHWQRASNFVAGHLLLAVQRNPSHYAPLLEMLRPVRDRLVGPLAAVYRQRERPDSERSFATTILAEYAADNPPVLASLLLDADDKQFTVLYPTFKGLGEPGRAVLTGEIDKKPPPGAPDDAKEELAKRQANAAVALLRLSQPAKVWPLLKHSPDPRVRSYLIHRLGPMGADAKAIVQRLDEEGDVSIRRALLLSLGEYGDKEFSLADRPALLPKLQEMYRTDADPGLHAAAEWLLRTWHQEAWLKQVNEVWAQDKAQREKRLENIQRAVTQDQAKTPPQWYVNGQGQTMVVIPGPVEFRMGSPLAEEGRSSIETQHPRRIRRTFALASKAVTVREFRRFLRANKLEQWFDAGGQAAPLMKKYSPEENGPIILVDWYTAAAYCNWLSQQEGIPEEHWCYETNARQLSQEKVRVGVSLLLPQDPLGRAASTSFFLVDRHPQVTALKQNCLGLRGYRLPLEAEVEYACRAGAVTSRYYGETAELLAQYGWYVQNSKDRSWPVGLKKPNDLGFFDLHGNVWTWCQEGFWDYTTPKGGEIIEDKDDYERIIPTIDRVLRGGSFINHAVNVRSAYRLWNVPTNRFTYVGLRPARTFR